MGCERDCESCGCGSEHETELQRNEEAEQLEHERSSMQLFFWSAVALPVIALFFGVLCLLSGIGVLPELPVIGFSGFILIFVIWYFLITR